MKMSKQKREALRKIFKSMRRVGLAGGVEIAEVAAKLHPNALLIMPLYRSCMVVLPPSKKFKQRGAAEIKLYHDPCWMGADKATEENLPEFCEDLWIVGQRSGPTLLRNKEEVRTFRSYEYAFAFHSEDKRMQSVTKRKKWTDKGKTSYSLKNWPWLEKLDPEVRAELHGLGYDVFPPREWIPPFSQTRYTKPKKGSRAKK